MNKKQFKLNIDSLITLIFIELKEFHTTSINAIDLELFTSSVSAYYKKCIYVDFKYITKMFVKFLKFPLC